MKKILILLKAAGIVIFAVLVLVFSEETAASIKCSIDICISSIIPSMFAFMIIAAYIINSGLYRYIFRPLYFVFNRIIKLDELSFSVFILSLIGGYPTGAKLLKDTVRQNPDYCDTAARILSFSYCISPSFAVIMLGKGVFGSVEAGYIIYISNVLSCVIISFFFMHKDKTAISINKSFNKSSLINAVNAASTSLFTVCTVLIAFNIAVTIAANIISGLSFEKNNIFFGFLEISNLLKAETDISMLPVVSMISSFGGICVLLQTISIVDREFSLKYFIISRVPCALLSGLISILIINCHEIALETGTNGKITYYFSADKAIVPIIAIMCIIIFKESNKNFKKV